MPRRNGSRAAILEAAILELPGATCSNTVAKHAREQLAGMPDGKLHAVKLPTIDGVSARYVAPQLDDKGKPQADGATVGAKTWRSAWYSLAVNAYRRDGDGPAFALAVADMLTGEPFVTSGNATYMVVSDALVKDARKAAKQ